MTTTATSPSERSERRRREICVAARSVVVRQGLEAMRVPEGLIAFIREQGRDAKVRPDMKLVLFAEWDDADDRLKGVTALLRRLAAIAERAKAA